MASAPRRSTRRASSSALLTPPLTDSAGSSSGGNSGGRGRGNSNNNSNSSRSRRHDGVLTVPAPGEEGESNFIFHVEHLYGNLPKDTPYWRNMAFLHDDRRGVGPLTLRYASKGKGRLLRDGNAQDDVREKIWTRVRELVPDGHAQDVLPRVVFGESADGQIVDLVFQPCASGEDALHEFRFSEEQMRFQTEYNGTRKWHTYDFVCNTNSIDGSILPFEIHGLPIDHIEAKDLFDGVTRMASPIGKVLAIGNVVMTSQRWDLVAHPSGTVRGYVKLSSKSMALPWPQLSTSLPTLFKWDGVDYRLTYPGEQHRSNDITSIDYCPTRQQGEEDEDGEDDEGSEENSAATAANTPEPQASSSAASGSASSVKRRRVSGR